MSERIWITWEIQRRNRSMSKVLGATLHELVLNAPAWRRYPVLIVRTVLLIWKTRPEIIFSQNPSLVLAGVSVLTGKILKIPVIIDAHNAGLFPIEGKSKILNKLARLINGGAFSVIVSNFQLKTYVESHGANAYIFPDPIPEISCRYKTALLKKEFNIVFVCSWAEDEPYKEVIRAANKLESPVRIFMTGNSKNRHSVAGQELPGNVELTGFISNDEFESLLCGCDAVMVLTSRDDCLVCGAYEGVAVEKPLIISNTEVLKQYFKKGCIYTENTEFGICEAINKVVLEQVGLSQQVKEFKADAIKSTEKMVCDLERRLSCLSQK